MSGEDQRPEKCRVRKYPSGMQNKGGNAWIRVQSSQNDLMRIPSRRNPDCDLRRDGDFEFIRKRASLRTPIGRVPPLLIPLLSGSSVAWPSKKAKICIKSVSPALPSFPSPVDSSFSVKRRGGQSSGSQYISVISRRPVFHSVPTSGQCPISPQFDFPPPVLLRRSRR